MGGSYQQFTGIGRLTRTPELRFTPNGTAIAKFALAFNWQTKSQNGETKDHVLFLESVAWGKRAESLAEKVDKGHQLFVVGHFEEERWEKDGQERRKMVLQIEQYRPLGGPKSSGGQHGESEEGFGDGYQ